MTPRRSRRRRVAIEVRENTIVLRGWRVEGLAEEAGCRPVYSGTARGWVLDRTRLDRLLAYLDCRHLAYALEDPDQGDLFADGEPT